MNVLTRSTPRRMRRQLRRDVVSLPAPSLGPPPSPLTALMRERDAGGPEDRACYQCSCGYVFEAAVVVSVDCPHCGGTQAW
jgi:hypothetical protein